MGDRSHAAQLYNAGVAAINAHDNPQRLQHAFQCFVSACYADPLFGQALYQAGNNASDLNQLQTAIACYRRALECETTKEERAKIHCNLGWRLHSLGYTDEAFKHSMVAIELEPQLVYGWLNLSLIYGMLGKPDQGVVAARKAFDLAPTDPVVEMALAFALLFNHEFAEGLKHFEARFRYKLKNFLSYPYPAWDGTPDKTIFLVADQGLGDTLCYARFVEAACKKSRYVHACVQPELMRLFSHAFMHIPNLNLMPSPANFPQADYWSTFVSLPHALGLTDQEIRDAKHIEAPVFGIQKSWKVPDRRLHIGIAWGGSPLNEINEHRSIPVTRFLDLYKTPGIQLYSLQVDTSKQQLGDNGCTALVRDLSGYISDVTDTVAILRELDLVITVESALGHICALADKETWIPYSYQGRDYRLGLDGTDRLWCPKTRVFPQGPFEPWEKVFDRINEALGERVR